MKMALARTLALTALPLLAACGAADRGEVLETIRATEQAQLQAIASKDLRGATRNYAEDAVLVAPGEAPVGGLAAIEVAFKPLLADANLKLEIEPGEGWAAESGELAVTTFTGTLTTTDAASGQPVTVPIANQTVWRRADGIGWQIVSDVNTALPQPAAMAEAS
jgi:ketosteroid isomerase-like protein